MSVFVPKLQVPEIQAAFLVCYYLVYSPSNATSTGL
jgi:hypothetical protein